MDPIQRSIEKWLDRNMEIDKNMETYWIYFSSPYHYLTEETAEKTINRCQIILGDEKLFDTYFIFRFRTILRSYITPQRGTLIIRNIGGEHLLSLICTEDKDCSEEQSLQNIKEQFIKIIHDDVPLNSSLGIISRTTIITKKTLIQ